MASITQARKVLEMDEGVVNRPYKDIYGLWTIGIGHLIGRDLTNLKISERAIEAIFIDDYLKAEEAAKRIIGAVLFDSLTQARQVALISMVFSLGEVGFSKFVKTIAAIKEKNWDKVAEEVLNSKWSHDVDPGQRLGRGRDDRVAYMFRTGEFHPEYGI